MWAQTNGAETFMNLLEAPEVPAPTCEVTIDGCETGIEYEASLVDNVCKLCLLQQLLCSLWLWIMHSNIT